MEERYQTIKLRRETYRRLKILAAQNDEKLMDLIDRLARQADSVTGSDTKLPGEREQHGPSRPDSVSGHD